jgi:uncharacterized protein
MTATTRERLLRLAQGIDDTLPRVIACSGGIDSMLLATVAHRQAPGATTVAHAISPAVPAEATARVRTWAQHEGWQLRIVRSGEFENEDYLRNPVNRCYYCKSRLYDSLDRIAGAVGGRATLMSGANTDDLGEYRPGLVAAREYSVRHPYVEADIDKAAIRSIARHLSLPFAALPASPCLASRLYTGTRVTAQRLRAVEESEGAIRRATGIEVVRCRIREDQMYIEVGDPDRAKITAALLETVAGVAMRCGLALSGIQLDPEPYRPGRAFVAVQ